MNRKKLAYSKIEYRSCFNYFYPAVSKVIVVLLAQSQMREREKS